MKFKFLLTGALSLLLVTKLFAADTVRVNSAITYQTIKGWGGTGGQNTQFEGTPPYLITQIINESATGIGLNGLRYESYQGNYAQSYGQHHTWEWMNDNHSPDTLVSNALDTTAVDYYMNNLFVPWKSQVVANGDSFTFYMSPSWYFNGSTGDIPAWLRFSPGEYAEYYLSNLNHLKNKFGLVPDYVTMCNEAGNNNQFYEGVVATMIKTVMPWIQANGFATTFCQYPECVTAQQSWQYIDSGLLDPGIWPYIKCLSYHKYGTNDPYRHDIDSLANLKGIMTAQTEEQSEGIDEVFNDLTLAGVSYWDCYGNGDYCPQNANNTWYTHAAKYWSFREIMHYNRPGSVVVSAISNDTPRVRTIAFNKGGNITTFILNDNAASTSTTVTITGLPPGNYAASQILLSGSPYTELGVFTVGGSGMLTIPVSNQAAVSVYPHSANLPPVPTNWAANPTYLDLPSSTVALTSSGVDPELSAVSYHWTVDSFPSGATVVLSNANIASPTASGMTVAGNYVFTIHMADGTDTTRRQVTVPVFPNNQAPVIQALQSRMPVIVTLPVDTSVIHGFAFDIEADALTYNWSIVSQPSGASAALRVLSGNVADIYNMAIAGNYVVQYSVSDPTHTTTRNITIPVYPVDDTPTITSVVATPAAFSAPTDSTQLSAVTSDGSGDTITHWWTVQSAPAGANPVFSLQGERVTEVRNITRPGSYIFKLTLVNRTHLATTFDTVNVNLGSASVCIGSAVNFVDSVPGGTWSSSNTSVAAAGSATGLITGVTAGSAVITYNVSGSIVTGTVTVSPLPVAITGTTGICDAGSGLLTDATGGGAWSSGNTAIVAIGSSTGVFTGISAGTAIITYAPGAGCTATAIVTVNPSPSAISGTSSVCPGLATSLVDLTSGGTWASSNTAIATVGSATGIVTGVSAGTSVITYSLSSGCWASTIVTVKTTPDPISGVTAICLGGATLLSDIDPGGTWSSGSPAIAVAGASTGVITGLALGPAQITFTLPTGCITTIPVTVYPNPAPITGSSAVCVGAAASVSDATGGGTWSSTNPAVISYLLVGVSPGTATITYMLGTGCFTTRMVTVSPTPAAITGTGSLCAGSVSNLSDATAGGIWSSSNTAVADVGPGTGVVSGVSAGTASITYSLAGSCYASKTVTVYASPSAIPGPSALCVASTMALSDSIGGGMWTSSNTVVGTIGASSGIVSGVSIGTTMITYAIPDGCLATKMITVSPVPAPIFVPGVLCTGSPVTLTDIVPGGLWVSGNTSVAVIGSLTGSVTGISPGTAIITYSLGTGCVATRAVTVYASPSAITGVSNLCSGSAIILADATLGGTWISSNTSVAITGSASGSTIGISAGAATISYVTGSGCYAAGSITVNPTPAAITGPAGFCIGNVITLSDAVTGGTWSSSMIGIAYIGTTSGIVSSMTAGTAIISYTTGPGCVASRVITVYNSPSPVSGPHGICALTSVVLGDAITGGTWVSGSPGVASIGSLSGILSALSAGTTMITYTVAGGCSITDTIEVAPAPAAITVPGPVCIGGIMALTDSISGGDWISSNTSVASVGLFSGAVMGVSAGTAFITYSLGSGCMATAAVTVSAGPGPITGPSTVCAGGTIALSSPITGGVWGSSNVSIAIAGSSTGVVAGVSAGAAVITYTVGAGCSAIFTLSVISAPAAITGISTFCIGTSVSLTDATGGGSWSSSNTSVAVIGSGGIASGVSSGATIITYAIPGGCFVTYPLTVTPLPGPVTGTLTICSGSATTLSDVAGGSWSSGNTSIATIGSLTGILTGVTAGTAGITYRMAFGCAAISVITVVPAPPGITGPSAVCTGAALADSAAGGTWSSGNLLVATIGSFTGVLTAVSAGTAEITYGFGAGCVSTRIETILSGPTAIIGAAAMCAGQTISLSDITSGGLWSSGAPGTAAIGSATGIVSGVAAGTAIISYTLPTGCYATTALTVSPIPAAIAGAHAACAGTAIALSEAVAGGIWSSSSPGIATAASTSGIVTAIAAGTAIISYSLPGGCFTTVTETINPSPSAIVGATLICGTGALTDSIAGGAWSSSNTAIAAIGTASGAITGVAAGTAIISYILPAGCIATKPVMIGFLPVAGIISGITHQCSGDSTLLTDTLTGGAWSSSNTSLAVVNAATGWVTGMGTGIDTIIYSISNICGTDRDRITDTVFSVPVADSILGESSVCAGDTIVVTDSAGSGIWTSSNTLIATVSSDGAIAGIAAGTASISYTVTTPCGAATAVLELAVSPASMCSTGIKSAPASGGMDISVEPNPNNGVFLIKGTSGASNDEDVTVEITDMLGQRVFRTKFLALKGNMNEQIILSHSIANGVYMLNIVSGAGNKVFQIVVQH
jgi:uncharacterized protein YjdB